MFSRLIRLGQSPDAGTPPAPEEEPIRFQPAAPAAPAEPVEPAAPAGPRPGIPDNPAPGSLEFQIMATIKTCYDPEIPVNIFELGLIYGVGVDEEKNVTVVMTLTSPNCPAAQSLPGEVQTKVGELEGVKSVTMDLTFDPPWDMSLMSDAAKLELGFM